MHVFLPHSMPFSLTHVEFLFLHTSTPCAQKPEKPTPHLHTSVTRLLPKRRIKAISQQWCCLNAYLCEFMSDTDALSSGLHYPASPAPSARSKYGAAHWLDSRACAHSSCDLIGWTRCQSLPNESWRYNSILLNKHNYLTLLLLTNCISVYRYDTFSSVCEQF